MEPTGKSPGQNQRASKVRRTVDARQFGLNAAVWDSVFDTATTVNLLTDMGNQALRFPGGSLSDDYHWSTNTTSNNTWQWATSFNKFAQVATTVGSQVFITVNYGSGTPAEAAAWVNASNVTNHYGFKYWEIGNENYGSWETDTNTRPHDPYTYAQRFQAYYTQMKAVDPTIKIGAVAITGEDSDANYTDHPVTNPRTGVQHNGWTPVMLATLRSLGVTPDFLIYHRYPQAPGAETDQGLLLSSGTWASDAADFSNPRPIFDGTASDFQHSGANPVPFPGGGISGRYVRVTATSNVLVDIFEHRHVGSGADRVDQEGDFLALDQAPDLLHRLGWTVGVVEADEIDLAAVHAALFVDHREIGGCGNRTGRIGRCRTAIGRRGPDLDFGIGNAGAVMLLCERRCRGKGQRKRGQCRYRRTFSPLHLRPPHFYG